MSRCSIGAGQIQKKRRKRKCSRFLYTGYKREMGGLYHLQIGDEWRFFGPSSVHPNDACGPRDPQVEWQSLDEHLADPASVVTPPVKMLTIPSYMRRDGNGWTLPSKDQGTLEEHTCVSLQYVAGASVSRGRACAQGGRSQGPLLFSEGACPIPAWGLKNTRAGALRARARSPRGD